MTILNRPETKYIYEFEVVTFWMTNENEEKIYMHDSFHTNGFEAEQRALEKTAAEAAQKLEKRG